MGSEASAGSALSRPGASVRAQPAVAPTAGPMISVIVNTCDRSTSLSELLRHLEQQTYSHFEVVVVVGPTRDDTMEMLERDYAERVQVVPCDHFNLSVSRNVGLTKAAGEVVAFIDDDALPSRRWLEHLAGGFADPTVAGVGGVTWNVNPDAGGLQFRRGVISVLAEQLDVRDDPSSRAAFVAPEAFRFPRLHGCNMSYRLDVLREVGGFDERNEYLFDDADIGVRLGVAGHRLLHLDDAAVYHAPSSGRNRGRHPYDLNWYCWLRSTLYFVLKNGGPAVGWRRAIGHALRTTSRFYTEAQEAVAQGNMPRDLYAKAVPMLRRGVVEGFLSGLVGRRRIPRLGESPGRHSVPFLSSSTARPDPAGGASRSSAGVNLMASRPLHICLLSHGYPPSSTEGVARSTHTLAVGLAELGHHVHVVTSGRDFSITRRDGVWIHEVSGETAPRYGDLVNRGYGNVAGWLDHGHAVWEAVSSLVRNDGIEIVDSPLWGFEGLVTTFASRIPMVVRVVTAMRQIAEYHDQPTPQNALLADLERALLVRAAAVVSNSRASVRALQDVYGLDREPSIHRVIPYGTVPSPEAVVRPLDDDRVGPCSVLYVGRLEKRKGTPELLAAIPEVLERRPETRFVLAGTDNSREDGFYELHGMDYRTFFRTRFGGCTDAVTFAGFVDDHRLTELYRSCDLFVAPSLYESFGLIYLEAMDMARPVVGCNAGGPADIIVDGETGRLIPPGDSHALAEAVVELLDDPPGLRRMGLAGRRRLLESFSHTAMAEGFAGLYRETIAAGDGVGRDG